MEAVDSGGQLLLTMRKMLLYNGHEEHNASCTGGVALLPMKETQKALIGWEVTACFRTERKNIRINVVQYHAPTNNKS